jgi:hypothetical protein
MLIKKSEERGDEIPALVYASAAWLVHEEEEEKGEKSGSGSSTSDDENNDQNEAQPPPTSQTVAQQAEEHTSGEMETLTELAVGDQPTRVGGEEEEEGAGEGEGAPRRRRKKKKAKKKKEREGVRLGLGDFCFYGILVTRAARLGWDLIILCVFAVVLGLGLTLLCLVWLQRPLPALPFSLILGIIFFLTGAFTFRRFDISIRANMIGF